MFTDLLKRFWNLVKRGWYRVVVLVLLALMVFLLLDVKIRSDKFHRVMLQKAVAVERQMSSMESDLSSIESSVSDIEDNLRNVELNW